MLLFYVQNADKRALANTETQTVYVVEKPIAAGTSADKLSGSVVKKEVPKLALASDTVTDLKDLGDKVTSVALVPGEQLLASRMVAANAFLGASRVQVPEGLQEITLKLPIERVVGGTVKAGDTVGIFISMSDATTNSATGQVVTSSEGTQLVFHKVLVTAAQFSNGAAAQPAESETTEEGKTGTAPAKKTGGNGTYLITLARNAVDAEKLVFATEFGSIYLSKEPATATEGTTGIVNKSNVFR